MAETQFYFLSEKYYLHFPDDKLMRNKEMEEGKPHNRPCFFAFSDENYPEIKWIVPISSRCEKYKKLYKIKQEMINAAARIQTGTGIPRKLPRPISVKLPVNWETGFPSE